MKVHILAISDSDKDFKPLVHEYTKRLGKSVSITNLKPIKHGTPEQIIDKETELLISKLEKLEGTKVVLLSKFGTQRSSEHFARMVETDHITFVIGGPYGLDEEKLLTYIQETVSFGTHTMPHGLVKVVLLEQIWRAHCINSGKSYHY